MLLALALASAGSELTVAAAADLSFAMNDLAAGFERQTGDHVRITYGSSGNLVTQISGGAPFDLFFSADVNYARRLVDAGLTDPHSFLVYGIGKLVLWSPRAGVAVQRLGMATLLEPAVHRIAIANPEHAPYGRAAVAALRHAGIYDHVRHKLVLGENISQAAQFVESGNAEVGVLALSVTLAPGLAGQSWEIPSGFYPPIEQAAVITSRARDKQAAEAFLAYVKSPAGKAILQRYGFAAPQERKP
jgi:molybdate transport system substrate-binding protein